MHRLWRLADALALLLLFLLPLMILLGSAERTVGRPTLLFWLLFILPLLILPCPGVEPSQKSAVTVTS
jgi:hypothetical protein